MAIEEARHYLTHGLMIPEKCKLALDEYRSGVDSFTVFLEEKCDLTNPDATIQASVLYQTYRHFCDEWDFTSPLSNKKFGLAIKQRFESWKSHGVMVYKGISVVNGINVLLGGL